jgi:hypothetical protein
MLAYGIDNIITSISYTNPYMKRVLKLLFPLFVLTLNLAQATNHFSFTERDSCKIAKYRLYDLQTVFGKAGLKLADLIFPTLWTGTIWAR